MRLPQVRIAGWRDCLNQDLLDFRDGGCLPARAWLDGRLRVLYESSREFARVYVRFGLSELQFIGFGHGL